MRALRRASASPARRARAASRLQHALDRVARRRGAPHPDARRRVHVPADTKEPAKPGRLRLLYEANPMAMLIEQAGGRASHRPRARARHRAEALHQRVPLILGSRCEVERIERYHREADAGTDRAFESPLFNTRCAVPRRDRLRESTKMSQQHPIIAITGSSGAGTTSVTRTFQHDLPSRGDQRGVRRGRLRSTVTTAAEMKDAMAEAAEARQPPLQPLRARGEPVRRARDAVRRATARAEPARSASTCTTRRRRRRSGRSRARSRRGRSFRATPTCCSTKVCTARRSRTRSTSPVTSTC